MKYKIYHRYTGEFIFEGNSLAGADLKGANLYGANLWKADLRGANLWKADLRDAYLRDADLRDAHLSCAYLYGAYLYGANLWKADLRDADLRDAYLYGANLRDADLRDAYLPNFQIVPETGSFTAYKKVRGSIILQLEIPTNAKRTNSLVGRKCRTDKAIPIAAFDLEGNLVEGNEFVSTHDKDFKYVLGEMVEESGYDDDIRVECTSGIHFFITFKEAVEY